MLELFKPCFPADSESCWGFVAHTRVFERSCLWAAHGSSYQHCGTEKEATLRQGVLIFAPASGGLGGSKS